jgi:hypothetical protein
MQIVGPMFEGLGRLLGGLVGCFLSVLNMTAGGTFALAGIPYAIGAFIMKLVDLFLGFLS